MNDGVIFADIVLVAQDLAVVRTPSADGAILGLCRVPSVLVLPGTAWRAAVDGTTLPLIVHLSEEGLIIEAVIDGAPLIVTLMGSDCRSLTPSTYPWTTWSHSISHDSRPAHLAQGTHGLVGILVMVLLLVVIATRRQAYVDHVGSGATFTLGGIVRSAFGGMFGFGRDSFTRFPRPTHDRGSRST